MYRLNAKIRLTMLCLSGFELYSRWVPLSDILRLGRLCCVQSQLTNLSRIKEPHTDSTWPTR